MKITVIGTELLGLALISQLSPKGYDMTLAPIDIDTARQSSQIKNLIESGVNLQPIPEAVDDAEAVMFAFPWYQLTDVERLTGKLTKQVIIDTINPLRSSGSLSIGHKWSAGEEIQHTFPLAYVVKGFNHLYADHILDPTFGEEPISAFYCSDHDQAKQIFASLAQTLGFDPVDVGPIKHARYLEPMATLWLQMAFHIGMGPDMTFTLRRR